MSIDAKGIPVLIWKFLRFSMLNFCKLVQKYPIASGVVFVFFLLYLFLPSLFSILIFTSPILAIVGVIIRFRLNSKRRIDFEKKNDDKPKSDADQRSPNPNPSFRREKSVRRNVRKENSELDLDGNIITLTNPLDEILGRKHTLLKDRKGKTNSTLDTEEDVSTHHLVSDSEQSEPSSMRGRGFFFGETESMEDADDEDEEGLQEDRNKAVEWTEDDQKNLMDLGISELERNKRLESLIARRRSRKLFRMAVEKSLMDIDSCVPSGQIAPIFVAKGNQLNDFKAPEQMPGSAPSILLPGRNPFDLPYDPEEEKPNLTGDSFQQEFMDAHHKDMFFSRHESFCRGPFFSIEAKHNFKDPQFDFCVGAQEKAVERPKLPTLGKQSDKGGCEHPVGSDNDLIKLDDLEELPREEHSMNEQNLIDSGENNEVPCQQESSSVNETEGQTEIDTRDNKCSSSSSSSSETDERILERKRFPEVLTYHVRKALLSGTPPKSPSVDKPPLIAIASPTEYDKARVLDHLSFFKAPLHTPSNSIASDLQVEVSEGGSPRHGVDEDLIHYDADTDRGNSSDNDEKWDCSFQERRDEKGSNSDKEHEDSVATSLTSETREIENSQSYSKDTDHGCSEGMEATIETGEGSRTDNISIKSSPEVDFKKQEESTKQCDILEVKPNEDPDGARLSIKKEPLSDLEKPDETVKSKSCKYIPVNAGWSYDQSIMAYEKMLEMNQSFKSKNIPEQVQGENMLVLIQDGEDDQDVPSMVEPRLDGHVASAIPPRFGIEQDPVTSNPFASPRTVLLPEVLKDQQILENSADHSPKNSSVGKLEEQSNGTTSQINEPHLEHVEGTKDGLIKSSISDSETVSVNHKDAEAKAENPTKHVANASPSKSVKESSNSSGTETASEKDQTAERISENSVNELEEQSFNESKASQMNEPHLEHKDVTEDSLIKSTVCDSKTTLSSNSVAEKLPQPAEESNHQSVKHTEAKAENLTKHDANASPSKSGKENNANSSVTETAFGKDQNAERILENSEPTNSSIDKLEEHVNTNEPHLEHKEGTEDSKTTLIPQQPAEEINLKSVKNTEAKAENLTKHDANISPSKSGKENADSNVADTTFKKEDEGSNATPSKPDGGSDSSSGIKIIEELKELIGEGTPKLDENNQDKPPGLLEGNQPLESVKSETKDIEKEKENGHVVAG